MSNINTQSNITGNVKITVKDAKTGKNLYSTSSKNTVTKVALMGVIRLFNGEFGVNSNINIKDFYPKYLAVGNGIKAPSVVDADLEREYRNPDGSLERFSITRRILTNIYNAPTSEITFKIFIPNYKLTPGYNDTYNIQELGLFTDATSNTAFARTVLENPVIKTNSNTIDITWNFVVSSTFSGAVGG